MKTQVGEHGLVIPKEMLNGQTEVEVIKEGRAVIVLPLRHNGDVNEGTEDSRAIDPATGQRWSIWDLGKYPYKGGPSDGSVNHDAYIYGNPHGE